MWFDADVVVSRLLQVFVVVLNTQSGHLWDYGITDAQLKLEVNVFKVGLVGDVVRFGYVSDDGREDVRTS